jgi:hypothetical protein
MEDKDRINTGVLLSLRIFLSVSVALLSLLAGGCSVGHSSEVLLDVPSVINKTPVEVVELLGEPDTTYIETILGRKLFCQRYDKHNIEIQFPDSLSTEIVVYGPHGLPFTQSALKAFNIPHQKAHPSQHEKNRLMRWYDYKEFEAISFYNVQEDAAGAIENFSIFFKAKKR